MERAPSDRNLETTLIGLGLATFTFLPIFLYNRASMGAIDPVPLQLTLEDALGAAFSFASHSTTTFSSSRLQLNASKLYYSVWQVP